MTTRSALPREEQRLSERPVLAANVRLVGELQGSGFRDRQWLVERDGRLLQLSELLYRIAEQIDGRQTLAEIAAAATQSTGRLFTVESARQIIETKLIPVGLVADADTEAAHTKRQSSSPLAVTIRARAVGPEVIDPPARVLQWLYLPWILLPLLCVVGLAHEWLYLSNELNRGISAVLGTPMLLLAVFAVLILGNVAHELGHASALRYSGGRAREMGVALYLVYPAFYTDTTDSYRLGRWARVRTDLGGFYFHLLFATALIGLSVLLHQDWLLVVAALIDADILYQLLPFVRFDGYWAFADLTGVPDFFSQMAPLLRSWLPRKWSQGVRLPALKRWARLAFALYLAMTVPILALLGSLLVLHLPQIASTSWHSLQSQAHLASIALRQGNGVDLILAAIQALLLVLQGIGIFYLLVSFSGRALRFLWRSGNFPRFSAPA